MDENLIVATNDVRVGMENRPKMHTTPVSPKASSSQVPRTPLMDVKNRWNSRVRSRKSTGSVRNTGGSKLKWTVFDDMALDNGSMKDVDFMKIDRKAAAGDSAIPACNETPSQLRDIDSLSNLAMPSIFGGTSLESTDSSTERGLSSVATHFNSDPKCSQSQASLSSGAETKGCISPQNDTETVCHQQSNDSRVGQPLPVLVDSQEMESTELCANLNLSGLESEYSLHERLCGNLDADQISGTGMSSISSVDSLMLQELTEVVMPSDNKRQNSPDMQWAPTTSGLCEEVQAHKASVLPDKGLGSEADLSLFEGIELEGIESIIGEISKLGDVFGELGGVYENLEISSESNIEEKERMPVVVDPAEHVVSDDCFQECHSDGNLSIEKDEALVGESLQTKEIESQSEEVSGNFEGSESGLSSCHEETIDQMPRGHFTEPISPSVERQSVLCWDTATSEEGGNRECQSFQEMSSRVEFLNEMSETQGSCLVEPVQRLLTVKLSSINDMSPRSPARRLFDTEDTTLNSPIQTEALHTIATSDSFAVDEIVTPLDTSIIPVRTESELETITDDLPETSNPVFESTLNCIAERSQLAAEELLVNMSKLEKSFEVMLESPLAGQALTPAAKSKMEEILQDVLAFKETGETNPRADDSPEYSSGMGKATKVSNLPDNCELALSDGESLSNVSSERSESPLDLSILEGAEALNCFEDTIQMSEFIDEFLKEESVVENTELAENTERETELELIPTTLGDIVLKDESPDELSTDVTNAKESSSFVCENEVSVNMEQIVGSKSPIHMIKPVKRAAMYEAPDFFPERISRVMGALREAYGISKTPGDNVLSTEPSGISKDISCVLSSVKSHMDLSAHEWGNEIAVSNPDGTSKVTSEDDVFPGKIFSSAELSDMSKKYTDLCGPEICKCGSSIDGDYSGRQSNVAEVESNINESVSEVEEKILNLCELSGDSGSNDAKGNVETAFSEWANASLTKVVDEKDALSPPEEIASLIEETPSLPLETALSSVEPASLIGETVSAFEETALIKETPSPSEETPSPFEEPASPLEESVMEPAQGAKQSRELKEEIMILESQMSEMKEKVSWLESQVQGKHLSDPDLNPNTEKGLNEPSHQPVLDALNAELRSERSKVNELRTSLEAGKQQLDDLLAQMSQEQLKSGAHELSIKDLENKCSLLEKDRLQSELKFAKELERLKSEYAKNVGCHHEEEDRSFVEMHEEFEGMASEVERLTTLQGKLKGMLDRVLRTTKSSLAGYTKVLHDYSKLQENHQSLKLELSHSERENKRLCDDVQMMESLLQCSNDSMKNLRQLHMEADEASEEEINNLKSQLSSISEAMDIMAKEKAYIEKSVEESSLKLHLTLEQLQNECQDSQTELKDTRCHLEEVKVESQVSQAELKDTQCRLEEVKAECHASQAELKDTQDLVKELQDTVSFMNDERDLVEDQMKSLTRANQEYQRAQDQLQTEVSGLQEELYLTQTDVSTLLLSLENVECRAEWLQGILQQKFSENLNASTSITPNPPQSQMTHSSSYSLVGEVLRKAEGGGCATSAKKKPTMRQSNVEYGSRFSSSKKDRPVPHSIESKPPSSRKALRFSSPPPDVREIAYGGSGESPVPPVLSSSCMAEPGVFNEDGRSTATVAGFAHIRSISISRESSDNDGSAPVTSDRQMTNVEMCENLVESIEQTFTQILNMVRKAERASKAKIRDLKEEIEDVSEKLKAKHKQVDKLEAEVNNKGRSLQESSDQVNALNDRVTKLTEAILEHDDLSYDVKHLKEDNSELEKEITSLKEEKDFLSNQVQGLISKADGVGDQQASLRKIAALEKKNYQLHRFIREEQERSKEKADKVTRRSKILETNWKKAEDEVYRFDELVEAIRKTCIESRSVRNHPALLHIVRLIDGLVQVEKKPKDRKQAQATPSKKEEFPV